MLTGHRHRAVNRNKKYNQNLPDCIKPLSHSLWNALSHMQRLMSERNTAHALRHRVRRAMLCPTATGKPGQESLNFHLAPPFGDNFKPLSRIMLPHLQYLSASDALELHLLTILLLLSIIANRYFLRITQDNTPDLAKINRQRQWSKPGMKEGHADSQEFANKCCSLANALTKLTDILQTADKQELEMFLVKLSKYCTSAFSGISQIIFQDKIDCLSQLGGWDRNIRQVQKYTVKLSC